MVACEHHMFNPILIQEILKFPANKGLSIVQHNFFCLNQIEPKLHVDIE